MKWIRLFFLSALLLSLPQFMKRDFKVPPIHADIPADPKWDMPPPNEEILAILDQPFIYLTHGHQSTVFQSQDGKYVLKLFRYRLTTFPPLTGLKNWFKRKPKQDFASKMEKTFNAAHIACTEAKEFTQAVYCHINLTKDLLPTLELKSGKSYLLPLDHYRFVLQKKANPFKETLLAAKDHPEEMRRLIDSFLSLLIDRSALNIRNSDPNLGPNFGFLDGKAVELDFGNYHKIEPNSERRKKEIENFMNRLEEWLKTNALEYIQAPNNKQNEI